MSAVPGWVELVGLLSPDPRDAGCAAVFELLDQWVELLLAGEDPAPLMPGMAVHLAACSPCADDVEGMSALARGA